MADDDEIDPKLLRAARMLDDERRSRRQHIGFQTLQRFR
jgi:hypothetical protein